jgi:hypothetical protein
MNFLRLFRPTVFHDCGFVFAGQRFAINEGTYGGIHSKIVTAACGNNSVGCREPWRRQRLKFD